jgi:hypothetical protein
MSWTQFEDAMILLFKHALLILKEIILLPESDNNVEAAVTHLLPADPVMENNNKNHRSNN